MKSISPTYYRDLLAAIARGRRKMLRLAAKPLFHRVLLACVCAPYYNIPASGERDEPGNGAYMALLDGVGATCSCIYTPQRCETQCISTVRREYACVLLKVVI